MLNFYTPADRGHPRERIDCSKFEVCEGNNGMFVAFLNSDGEEVGAVLIEKSGWGEQVVPGDLQTYEAMRDVVGVVFKVKPRASKYWRIMKLIATHSRQEMDAVYFAHYTKNPQWGSNWSDYYLAEKIIDDGLEDSFQPAVPKRKRGFLERLFS
jgi:hypothetical protein